MEQSRRLLEYVGDMDSAVGTEITAVILEENSEYTITGMLLKPGYSDANGIDYFLTPEFSGKSDLPIPLDTDATIYGDRECERFIGAVISHDLPVNI